MRESPASQDGSFCLKIMGFATPCETGAIAMIDKAPSPLRQCMIEDMTVRHFKEKVQKDYTSVTSRTSQFFSAARPTRRRARTFAFFNCI